MIIIISKLQYAQGTNIDIQPQIRPLQKKKKKKKKRKKGLATNIEKEVRLL